MQEKNNNNVLRLEKAQALEAGQDTDAERIILDLSKLKASDLFFERGSLDPRTT